MSYSYSLDFLLNFMKVGTLTTYCSGAGDRVKYIGASSAGLTGGLALLSHATTSGYRQPPLAVGLIGLCDRMFLK